MEATALNPTQMHLLKLFSFNNSESYGREKILKFFLVIRKILYTFARQKEQDNEEKSYNHHILGHCSHYYF